MHDIIQKTREAYNLIAQHFSNTRHRLWDELSEFSDLIHDGHHILDWGCGSGRIIMLFKDKKVKYYGVDQSAGLIAEAEKNFADEIKQGWVEFFVTDKKEKDFPEEIFDVVFMIASFHHLPNYKHRLALLKKVYKEMKTGGKIVLANWNLKSEWTQKNKTMNQFAPNDFMVTWKDAEGQPQAEIYYHHFEPEELKNLLSEAGFKVLKNNYDKQNRNLITLAEK